MSIFNTKRYKKNYFNHLIIGGGYVAEFHIRSSLCNKFKIFLIEPDPLKREYLNYIFPEIKTFENIKFFLSIHSIEKINLLSILLPPKIRQKVYEEIPEVKCLTLIEKPLLNTAL